MTATPVRPRRREPVTVDYLTVHCSAPDGGALIVAVGEIDLDSAPQLRRATDAALRTGTHEVHIDLSRITFCDSSGLHILVRARRLAARAGATVTVTASEAVARLLELTGIAPLFPDRPSLAAGQPAPGAGP